MESYARHEVDEKNDAKFIRSILNTLVVKKFKLITPKKIKLEIE